MGNYIGECCTPPVNKRFSNVYPDQSMILKGIDLNSKNEDNFIHIPEKQNIDKSLDFLDSKSILTDHDYQTLEMLIDDLLCLKNRLSHANNYTSYVISSKGFKKYSDVSTQRFDSITTIDSPPRIKKLDESDFTSHEANNALLLLEVLEGLFIYPDDLPKKNLVNPMIKIKVTFLPKNHETQEFSEVFFSTKHAEMNITPIWNEFFKCQLMNFDDAFDWQISISLHYTIWRTKNSYQIGEEQTFSLSSLIDQRVYVKQIDFKQPKTKAVLAKVLVRFQLIHDFVDLSKKLITEITNILFRLQKLRFDPSSHSTETIDIKHHDDDHNNRSSHDKNSPSQVKILSPRSDHMTSESNSIPYYLH